MQASHMYIYAGIHSYIYAGIDRYAPCVRPNRVMVQFESPQGVWARCPTRQPARRRRYFKLNHYPKSNLKQSSILLALVSPYGRGRLQRKAWKRG